MPIFQPIPTIRRSYISSMNTDPQVISIGETPQKQAEKAVGGEYVPLLGELYYKIQNYDAMEPFFISVVSSSDHWLFISSTGGLSAGRGSAEQAIFPYYTVDRLTENFENSGSKTILLAMRGQRKSLWEPFSDRQLGCYAIERNLYKNVSGTALVFEEKNLDLGLTFCYAWRTSEKFGFVKTSWLTNSGDAPWRVELLDGLQNLLPASITSQTQNTFSSLLDAYKRSELNPSSGLAILTLNSRLTDLAEPSESLLATTVLQVGAAGPQYLISSAQLDRFRRGKAVTTETEVRGQRGAYFLNTTLDLAPGEERSWHVMVDISQDAAAVVQKAHWLQGHPAALSAEIEQDIAAGRDRLWKIVASADGIQLSEKPLLSAHHFANVMFNVMRGGIFTDQYWIQVKDWTDFLSARNRPVLQANQAFFQALPGRIHLTDLLARAEASGSADLLRLAYAYLPLTFSRRHGDPSRPWNRFAINIRQPDGSQKLDYEGNWRDIFQNWEALACSYPEYVESMISTFLSATTVDGYNPYRITHRGLDWEVPEPGNPWANIGYWSDHQIIYLLKLMELSTQLHPGRLQGFLPRALFSYAQVPYRIAPYANLVKDPYNSIGFDWELEHRIEARQKETGTDGKLLFSADGQVQRATLAEKLLTLLLAKLANFVPEGGIWMNTQRPEWNDANNALVGKGLSVVTLCYLRRYVAFCKELFQNSGQGSVPLHVEVQRFFVAIGGILEGSSALLQGAFSDEQRRSMLDALGEAGSAYRWGYYQQGLSGEVADAPVTEIVAFLELVQRYIEHSLRANRRSDDLYHAYNVLHLQGGQAKVSYLYEMLEGQVAVLSSGLLNGQESLALLQSLRRSALFQPETHTYILYPDRKVPGFLEKNCLAAEQVQGIALLRRLVESGNRSLVTRDARGTYHFAGPIRNFKDVSQVLDGLKKDARYAAQVETDFEAVQALFEATFRHSEFTGRSGTFFAYEGLGSVYWHMVAKLLLVAQEVALKFRDTDAAAGLMERYLDIREGLGYNRSPAAFGAFPTDPYSHTPKGQGAKQPGMTGMVKEEILARQVELGCTIADGKITMDLYLLTSEELLAQPASFAYLDVQAQVQTLEVPAGALAYTICQTPVLLQYTGKKGITVYRADGSSQAVDGYSLDRATSEHIFLRDGQVTQLSVTF
jgi:hypothetical protein